MDSYTKLKLWVGSVLLISILIIGFAIYTITPSKNHSRGIISATELVNANDIGHRDGLKENRDRYAIIVQENGKYFLQLFGLQGNDYDVERKFTLSKKQFDSMNEGNVYWFDIKVYKPYDWKTGIVKRIYTYNPAE